MRKPPRNKIGIPEVDHETLLSTRLPSSYVDHWPPPTWQPTLKMNAEHPEPRNPATNGAARVEIVKSMLSIP